MSYDIFISYKAHDDNGHETRDCAIARELHDSLTEMGYTVFFSERTLEEMGNPRFILEIDTALASAKMMVVVLTNPEYAHADWVQHEWSTFRTANLNKPLYTLTEKLNVCDLPPTLRANQNFDYAKNGIEYLCRFIHSFLSVKKMNRFSVISGKQVSAKDIEQAIELDCIVYEEDYHVNKKRCMDWFATNPDIYVMVRDDESNRIIAYTNISPIMHDCYEHFKNGNFVDVDITADMLLSYDMPGSYDVCILSVVIHPGYRNTCVFALLLNAVVEKFLDLSKEEKFIRRVVADAVTKEGEKFCKMFGMTKVKDSNHESVLYEVSMLPPKFRVISKMFRRLFDYYAEEYAKNPWRSRSGEHG